MKKAIIIIVVLALSVISYMIYKKVTTKKDRVKPLPSWTKEDWLKNGYSEQEFTEAKKIQNTLLNFQPFI